MTRDELTARIWDLLAVGMKAVGDPSLGHDVELFEALTFLAADLAPVDKLAPGLDREARVRELVLAKMAERLKFGA